MKKYKAAFAKTPNWQNFFKVHKADSIFIYVKQKRKWHTIDPWNMFYEEFYIIFLLKFFWQPEDIVNKIYRDPSPLFLECSTERNTAADEQDTGEWK